MTEAETRTELTGQEIKSLIAEIAAKHEMCGFEVFMITKSEPRLKKMGFVEKGEENLRHKLRESILKALYGKYNAEEADYVSADRIADEQHKFYIIPTSVDYNPFSMLNSSKGVFSANDMNDATGIAFSVHYEGKQVWAYQHLWSIMVPNRSKKGTLARIVSKTQGDVFEEMADPLITFSEKVDLLVIDGYIITSDIKLLQNAFGFKKYINMRAEEAIDTVEDTGIVANIDKLRDYIRRGNGSPRYAKKMMRIADSKVLKMAPDTLWENIHKSPRWSEMIKNEKIKVKNRKFVLESYPAVECFIDLLDERYTRSEITGEEYDTEVKQLAGPINKIVQAD